MWIEGEKSKLVEGMRFVTKHSSHGKTTVASCSRPGTDWEASGNQWRTDVYGSCLERVCVAH